MTLANRITLARIGLTFVFLALLVLPSFWSRVAAFLLYLLATSTDWVDGFIARRTGTESAFGAMADPLADKLLVAAAFIVFLGIKDLGVPAWAVFLIVAREFLIMGLRSLAAVRGTTLRAERWGKWKMGIQSACVCLILLVLVVRTALRKFPFTLKPYHGTWRAWEIDQFIASWPWTLTIVAAVSALASGVWYLWRYRDLLTSSWEAAGKDKA